MKLADRSFMNETRYSQSFGDFSIRKNKLLSTGFTQNTMNTTMRLPKLSRSLSSASSKSALQRLNLNTEQMKSLQNKVDQLKMDTRESRRYVNYLKEDLTQRQLTEHKNNLMLQIKMLQNGFKFARKQNEDRTLVLKKDCSDLLRSSKQIINLAEALKNKIDNLEEQMGIYSAKEKHKF